MKAYGMVPQQERGKDRSINFDQYCCYSVRALQPITLFIIRDGSARSKKAKIAPFAERSHGTNQYVPFAWTFQLHFGLCEQALRLL